MACLGVHFAIGAEEIASLPERDDENDRLDCLQSVTEGKYLGQPEADSEIIYAAPAKKRR